VAHRDATGAGRITLPRTRAAAVRALREFI